MARVALVTGGTRGIGAAISVELKNAGYKVAANYGGNDEAAQKFKSETGIPVFKWDVGNAAACAAGIKSVEDALGPIDILVNNAGITRDAMLHKMTAEHWEEVIRVDLGSCFYMCRPLIDGMRERGFGRIINVSSINGQKGQMGQTNYSAAKAGVIGYSKAIARELATSGVIVNCVAPAITETELFLEMTREHIDAALARIPMGRFCAPDEIAAIVAFAASPACSFTTGFVFDATGGRATY